MLTPSGINKDKKIKKYFCRRFLLTHFFMLYIHEGFMLYIHEGNSIYLMNVTGIELLLLFLPYVTFVAISLN